jgi:plasmid stabilization system protein ParE
MAREPHQAVKPYSVAPEAEDDLLQIWRFLFDEAGIEIADRIQGELIETFEFLSDFPGSGHRRLDLTRHDVFFLSVY